MKYLRQFVIGSSYLIFLPFFYSVKNNQPKKTYNYYDYTLIAPVWFGIWNVLSLYLAERFNLTLNQRFLLVSIISALSVMTLATNFKSYKFSKKEWKKYYFKIIAKYLFIWNIVIFNIEKYL